MSPVGETHVLAILIQIMHPYFTLQTWCLIHSHHREVLRNQINDIEFS